MADRVITWFIENVDRDGTEQGPTYYADRDYNPVGLRVMVRQAPDAGDLTFNIKADGVSVLTRNGRLTKKAKTDEAADEFGNPPAQIAEGSLLTLDVTPNGAKGITVQLELDAT